MSFIGNSPITQAFLTDQFSGNGSTTTFTMTVAPATTSSILVSVTGVLQDPSTYSVSGTTLTFSSAPPTGTGNISVRYLGIPASGVTTTAYRTLTEFTATAGQTTFTPPSYTVGFLNVYRNGVLLGSADYTATNGTTVVLASGASVGDLVTTESFYVSSVLNALPNTGGTVSGNMAVVGTLTTTSGIGTNGASPAGTALIAGRVDSSNEGGQLDLCRSTDNTSAWAVDVYGNTSTPTFRIIDNVAGAARVSIDSTGVMSVPKGVSGTPAFSAYQSVSQNIPHNSNTKVQFQSESFDTNNCFDSTTNYRFTPTVAGYYYIYSEVNYGMTSNSFLVLYKNGTTFSYGPVGSGWAGISGTTATVTTTLYMNGTTDYVEIYAYQATGSAQATTALSSTTFFTGFLARGA